MRVILNALLFFTLVTINCSSQKRNTITPEIVYSSGNLIITRISENSFTHTTFLQTQDFGNVPCNGLIVRNHQETIIFDTPDSNQDSEELIRWITDSLRCKINAVIPTHFHNDCLGGLQAFHNAHIPSYAYFKTIELAKENHFTVPQISFADSLVLHIGNETIHAKFFGEGHTKDNVIGYFPREDIMFGGCLIKEQGATKGYLGDANIMAWPTTVEKVKKQYPHASIIIPGHGKYGSKELLDYTISLFKTK